MPNHIQPEPVQLFYSYAHEDEALREILEKHLKLLQRQGLLVSWCDRQIDAGSDWQHTIDEHLETASIILLLISPDFLASDYCYEIEMQRALERQRAGQARVIPLILRPCDWQTAPFGHLQALPRNGQPVTSWPDKDEALLQISRSLRALLAQPLPGSNRGGSATQNRANMLIKLQRMYDEMLDDSLQKLAWIDLPLTSVPGSVHTTANLLLRRATLPAQPLAPGTTIQQVYHQANQELLILGNPGAGKSTLLYQLGRDLLVQAQQTTQPFPVVFPLASWAQKRLPLQEWMVEQLCSPLYEVPRGQSRQWVQSRQILPLLDGLDEVEESARPACIAAINAFCRTFPLHPLVVCSRSQEYYTASQNERLRLYSAIEVQPMTAIQREEALQQAGNVADRLCIELMTNKELRELTLIPLWLNLLLVVAREVPLLKLPQERFALQRELLQSYVKRMCERKGDAVRYSPEQTTHWLGFLASQLRQRNQAIFALEELQPDWLDKRSQVWYRWSIGLIAGLIFSLIAGIGGGLIAGWGGGLLVGLGSGVMGGQIIALENQVTLVEYLVWPWSKEIRQVPSGILFIVLPILLIAILVVTLFFGLFGGLIVVLSALFAWLLIGSLVWLDWKCSREVPSRLSVPKNRSITALSQQFPLRLILTGIPCSLSNAWYA